MGAFGSARFCSITRRVSVKFTIEFLIRADEEASKANLFFAAVNLTKTPSN